MLPLTQVTVEPVIVEILILGKTEAVYSLISDMLTVVVKEDPPKVDLTVHSPVSVTPKIHTPLCSVAVKVSLP